ncbi:MAG: 2-succinyl-5-enolpyruvyl-6-hydroxy-3-cyclohexene-1-carboxylic-acid synthase [Cyclobacteriaceae bacterium]|nr:2-succinyl-5-enolpyruvyl-6-hydroxy-3-cyclohexene-1-carboxylic-acid synthase [Cyclobacteriaceae bacterium]
MNLSILHSLVDLCVRKGLQQAVICPGSRSAPLTLAFVRNKKINCRTFSDERSAAFIALGMAQQTGYPVALVCTSGSAAYNFAPAIAEAFFQQIPLVVFTADRPKEWIDQLDGQTIRQAELYGKHVKKYFELPQDYEHPDAAWHATRIINEAINLAQSGQHGPVHINAPFREPLYPKNEWIVEPPLSFGPKLIENVSSRLDLEESTWQNLIESFSTYKRILVVAGQGNPSQELIEMLTQFSSQQSAPVVGDILSNLHRLPSFNSHTDTYLGQINDDDRHYLLPDLLITFGKSLVSKNLKLFLRRPGSHAHWHLQEVDTAADTFKSLTKVIRLTPEVFFTRLSVAEKVPNERAAYKSKWATQELKCKEALTKFFATTQNGEFSLTHHLINN